MAIELKQTSSGVVLAIKVVPGAKRDAFAGEYGNGIKVRVSQPPEGGKANAAVIKLLAEALNIAASQIQLTRGQTSPRKEVTITGLNVDEITKRLNAAR